MKLKFKNILLSAVLVLGIVIGSLSNGAIVEAASYENVYVIVKIEQSEPAINRTSVKKISYNKNGFISKISLSQDAEFGKYSETQTWKYKNNKMKSIKLQFNSDGTKGTGTTKGTYDSKGRLTKIAYKGSDGFTHIFKYEYDKKGRIIKSTEILPENKFVSKFKYNSKGQVIKTETDDGSIFKSSYNKKGDVIKYEIINPDATITYTYDRTYNKKGLLTGVTQTDIQNGQSSIASKATFTYKKIRVKKKLAKMIKKQQNDELRF